MENFRKYLDNDVANVDYNYDFDEMDYFEGTYPFKIKPLRYNYNGLEPFIDEKTMILHHDKHLQGYINKLNDTLKTCPSLQNWSLTELIYKNNALPERVSVDVSRYAGGVYNHTLFFDGMSENIADKLTGEPLKQLIIKEFSSIKNFKSEFKDCALEVFGSGYAFLAIDGSMRLKILSTRNQMNPLSENLFPILNIDVWEHSYYLKHYNNRAGYIDDWFYVLNWRNAQERLDYFFAKYCK